MGNSQSQFQKFNESNWRRITKLNEDVQIFQNCSNKNIHIHQHHIETIAEQEFEKIRELGYLRKNHPRWVSALYFEDNQNGSMFCASKFQADLYLENIPIRLSNFKSIPFPDAVHLYDQALNGYFQFSKVVGCFIVKSDFMGINQNGVVKVWAGPRWQEVSINNNNVSESDMVRSIVNCLDDSIDRSSLPFGNNISSFLYSNESNINFETALRGLRRYVVTFNQGSIPARINHIEDDSFVSSNQYQKLRQFAQEQIVSQNSPFPEFNPQYTVLNPSPQTILYRQQPVEAIQVDSMRRVNSVSNFPVRSSQPMLVNHQQIRTIGNGPSAYRPQLNRSLSNPQLISGSQFRPPPFNPVVQSTNIPLYNNYGYNSQQVRPLVVNASRTNLIQKVSMVGNQEQPNKSLSIIKQQELVIYPPSQTEIPRESSFQQIPTSSRRQINERGNIEPQAQSIIMQLSKSQANTFSQYPYQPKYQQNQNIAALKRDYPTTVLSVSQTSFKGTPINQNDNTFFTPIGPNKREISNLNSIEQVHTENYWKDNSSKKSEAKQDQNNSPEPYSLNNLKQNYKLDTKELTFNNNRYTIINSNDGKSSEDFLQKLKSFNTNINIPSFDNPSTSYEYNSKKYDNFMTNSDYGYGSSDFMKNYSLEKKKEIDFADAFHTESIVKESSYEDYKTNELKPTSQHLLYQNDNSAPTQQLNLESKYGFGTSSDYNAGIDPQIWADIKKNQE